MPIKGITMPNMGMSKKPATHTSLHHVGEALTQYAGDASVREGLVKSLALQDSPMVQVALADVMVKLQEKRSVKALKTLLQKEDLNDLVKVKIEQTIKDLS